MRFYPARGMRYESQLAPPPHLVGLRSPDWMRCYASARREPRLSTRAREPRLSSRRAERRGPRHECGGAGREAARPDLRPHGFEIERGGLLDLDETAAQLVACGYERVEGGGARPVLDPRRHPRRLPGHRGAGGALRAVRHRGRAPHLVLHLHPALARGGRARGDRSGRRACQSTASWPRSRRRCGGAPRRGRGAAGRPLPWSCSISCRRTRSSRSPPRRSWRRRCATTGRT